MDEVQCTRTTFSKTICEKEIDRLLVGGIHRKHLGAVMLAGQTLGIE